MDNTLLMRPVKLATIKGYLKAAADFSLPEGLTDLCQDQQGNTTQYIKIVFEQIKSYEYVPNRREPVSLAMI